MAKEVTLLQSPQDLITSREETRAGFIAMALEKNYLAVPYIEEAKALKTLANRVKKPKELLGFKDLRAGLLTASGLSEKSLNYLSNDDKTEAIRGLIEEFLEPAGKDFVNELVYRYLLIKGDALGGKARNLAGTLGERKFLRSLISVLNIAGIGFTWKDDESNIWLKKPQDDYGIEKRIKALHWKNKRDILILLNSTIPIVKKNIDLSILNAVPKDLENKKLINQENKFIALGELKGGIDPAGADEHWKTANSALNRIRTSFAKKGLKPSTFFIGAAIEVAMAEEIFNQLNNKTLSHAANLTNDQQLTSICEWIINL